MPRERPIWWQYTVRAVSRFTDRWAVEYVEPAFSGDPDAALELAAALSNKKRGVVAVTMWDAKVPRPALRVYLESAWDHDHGYVIGEARTRRRLAAMFLYAAFALPDFIGKTVSVWRGTRGVSAARAQAGYSWTLDRDMACWFSMRFASPARVPLVLRAEVPREAIALYTNEREEAEVVLMHAPAASVDGTADEWQSRFEAIEAARRAKKNSALDNT